MGSTRQTRCSALAGQNATGAGLEIVEFRSRIIEDIPLPDASVELAISNCVINLSARQEQVLAEEGTGVQRPGRRVRRPQPDALLI